MENWNKIAVVTDLIRANVINAALHEVNIDTALINKKDSAYVFLGAYEIYVRKEDTEKALALIDDIEDIEYEADSEE